MNTQTSNINIKSPHGTMSYLFGYSDNDYVVNDTNVLLHQDEIENGLNIVLNDHVGCVVGNISRKKNYWTTQFGESITYPHFPQTVKLSSINMYFPTFSVDTYERNVKYAITINTWINGVKVCIGSYIVNRNDALATVNRRLLGNDYYEYIEIPIINPFNLIYGDEWDDFRKLICYEPTDINNTGALISILLFPVKESNIDMNSYIMLDNYLGAQGALNVGKNIYNNNLLYELNFDNETPGFKAKLVYNSSYNSIEEYVKETYNIKQLVNLTYNIEIIKPIEGENPKVLKLVSKTSTDEFVTFECNDTFNFDWESWEEGIMVLSFISIHGIVNYDGEDTNYTLDLYSNIIPFTKDIAKYFIKDINTAGIKKIRDDMQITVNKLDVINKIENKIIHLDNPVDSKMSISYPIFYKAHDLNNIIIHPDVTENICINLDAYKSKVKYFNIEIEKVNFVEIGRTSAGVIFKIVGKLLSKKSPQGLYYIKNESGEYITSGEYKYIV